MTATHGTLTRWESGCDCRLCRAAAQLAISQGKRSTEGTNLELPACDAYEAQPVRCNPWDIKHRGVFCDGRGNEARSRLAHLRMTTPVCYEHPCEEKSKFAMRVQNSVSVPLCRRHLVMNLLSLCGDLGDKQDYVLWPMTIKEPEDAEWIPVPEAIRRMQ